MQYLTNNEEKMALEFLHLSAELAKRATCERAKCGSIIIQAGEVIGEGFNSPPFNLETQRRCSLKKNSFHIKVTDKTCCVHAEQRAIMDALAKNPNKLAGSRLYFIRLDEDDKPTRAGEPYCTICSKMALDTGVAEFVLWDEKGVCVYNTEEYNDLSFEYGAKHESK